MKNRKIIRFLFLIFIVYMILDYINILTKVGINVKNINLEILNIFIVIALYMTTFYFIDRKQMEKEKNKNEIANIILKNIYEICLDNIYIFNDDIINNYIVPNCNFDKLIYEDEYMSNLLNQPFQNENIIYDLLKDGIISKKLYENYLVCKKNYREYITIRIMFYDKPELSKDKKIDVISELRNSLDNLNISINK